MHYFVPDTAATGQLHKELLDGMKEQFDITVICVVPRYLGTVDESYKKQKYFWETIDGVRTLLVSWSKSYSGYFGGKVKMIEKYGDDHDVTRILNS